MYNNSQIGSQSNTNACKVSQGFVFVKSEHSINKLIVNNAASLLGKAMPSQTGTG